MVWVKVDDRLHSHPKIRRAWQTDPISLGLYLLALSYSGDHLTDGAIDDAFVRQVLPSARRRERAIAALVDAGLWERNGSTTWTIHDYLDYNESRTVLLERRRAREETRQRNRRRLDESR